MYLRINNLQVDVDSLRTLEDINLDLNAGELVVVVGSNGSGKTTLMRAITGMCPASGGTIMFEDQFIQNLPPYEVSMKGIALVPEGRLLFQEMTVLENLEIGAYLHRRNKALVKKNLEWVLDLFPALEKYKDSKSMMLSGGEQQMVSIGRALMSSPKLLLLDELSLGLAPMVVGMFLNIVKQLKHQGMSILMVEQNIRQALKFADRGYVLDSGKFILEGSGQELLKNELIQKAYMGL
jgi:branched-chain amino acid transport system ATP-binding protein